MRWRVPFLLIKKDVYNRQPLLLSKVVDALDGIYELMNETQGSDVRGDTYEYLLNKIAQSGLNGQFRTPRHIIKMMVERCV